MYHFFQINRLYKLFLLFLLSILNFKEIQPNTCVTLKYLSGNRLDTNKFPRSLGVKDYICFLFRFFAVFLALFLSLVAFCSEELYQKISSLALLTLS